MSRQPVPVWSGVVDTSGRLHLDARGLFDGYLKRLKNQPVQLVIRKQSRPKSRSLMGYLFGVVYQVAAEHFGYMDYEIEALHDECMRTLRGLKPDPNPLQLRVSLAEQDHDFASNYVSDLRHWLLTEHGCVTPDAEKAEAA